MFYPKSPFLRYPLVENKILCKGNISSVSDIIPWLCQTPSITTYRVNLQKTTTQNFKQHIEEILHERYKLNCPKVEILQDIPEIVCIAPLKADAPAKPNNEYKEIIVDTCCGAAVLRGAHIYSIGVLAMESGTKTGDLVNIYADLEGKCKKGMNTRYESNQKIYLGQGKVLMQRYQLYTPNGPQPGIAIEILQTISGVPSIGDLSGSSALLQNLPSIVCVRVLGARKNELILDMCAAPGNKTTHICELIGDEGLIVALDKTENKIKLIKDKVYKNNYKSIKPYAFDSTKSFNENLKSNDNNLIPPFKQETFDRILLDAPCSALGNRPLLSSNMTPKMLESYPKVQKKLFSNAVPLLKCGGTLVYSTCTVNIEENEAIVAWALQKYPELQLQTALPKYGGDGWPFEGLTVEQQQQLQRFGSDNGKAGTKIDTVGFFIAKFVKIK